MNRNPNYDLKSEYFTVDLEGLYLMGYFKCSNKDRQALRHASPLVTVSEEGFVCLRSWLTFTYIPAGLLRELLSLLANLALPMLLNYYIYCNTDMSVTTSTLQ